MRASPCHHESNPRTFDARRPLLGRSYCMRDGFSVPRARPPKNAAHRSAIPCSEENFPDPATRIPCSMQSRESSAAHWNCSANRRQNPAESAEMAGNFKNSLLFSLPPGNWHIGMARCRSFRRRRKGPLPSQRTRICTALRTS